LKKGKMETDALPLLGAMFALLSLGCLGCSCVAQGPRNLFRSLWEKPTLTPQQEMRALFIALRRRNSRDVSAATARYQQLRRQLFSDLEK